MVYIVAASHGNLAKEMCASCEMILGELRTLDFVALDPNDGVEAFKEQLKSKLDGLLEGNDVLLLCDLLYGSPFNSAAEYMAQTERAAQIRLIAGLNLPMLLGAAQACMVNACDLDKAAAAALEQGAQGVMAWTMWKTRAALRKKA